MKKKKKEVLMGSALALVLMSSVVGCSQANDEETKKTTSEKENQKGSNKTDEQLAKEIEETIGKTEKPLFANINETELTEEEQEMVSVLQNATGVNFIGEDLYVIVAKQGENKVRFITETIEDNVVKVFLRKVDSKEEGFDVLLGRIPATESEGKEIWFIDAETNQPIQFEDLEEEVKKKNNEKSEATNVETSEKQEGDSVENPDAPVSSEDESAKEKTE